MNSFELSIGDRGHAFLRGYRNIKIGRSTNPIQIYVHSYQRMLLYMAEYQSTVKGREFLLWGYYKNSVLFRFAGFSNSFTRASTEKLIACYE